jgi:hypothetical protein
LAETSDLPRIASWKTPQPVRRGRERCQLETGAGAVKDKAPATATMTRSEEETTLRTQAEGVEEVP